MPACRTALVFLLACALGLNAHAQDKVPDWTVTIEDFHGSSGITFTHVITPQSIRTIHSTDFEGDEPAEVHSIKLNAKQLAAVRAVLNRVPLKELKDTYSPDQPLLGGHVHFTFEVPGHDKKEVLVWQGARVKPLKRVVDRVNAILPKKYRIRAMD